MSDVDPSEVETLHDSVTPAPAVIPSEATNPPQVSDPRLDAGDSSPSSGLGMTGDLHDGVIPSVSEGPGVVGGSTIVPPTSAVTAHRPTSFAHRLIAGLWFGSGVFLILAASAAFRAAGDPFTAANVVGAMLRRWHYIALFAPVLLLIFEWRRQRNRIVLLLFVAIIVAALQSLADVRIAAIRQRSIAPISSLDPANPLRREFGMLHGFSTLLLLADVLAAGALVLLEPDNR